jgi:predicted N-acetyltransferase YhbS
MKMTHWLVLFSLRDFDLMIPFRFTCLPPVAVSTHHQGKGVGKALISYGLNELKKRSVAVAITYGDPSFYSKVGFQALSEDIIQAPLKFSMPEGWLGQSLTGEPIPTIKERPTCVKEFDNPVYW